ncbi:MAG: nucleoside deaminase [Clostridia bacterium]|nr:nucleoside deaminase [Clostridia bacterium]
MAKYDTDRPIEAKKDLPEGIADRLPDGITDERKRREFFMGEALKAAEKSLFSGDVPVGCVIVRHNEIIAAAWNERELDKCATSHAELTAIERACAALGGWRLVSCELFVTLEPCPMCAGAIVNARVPKVYIGASDPKGGAAGGLFDLFSTGVNHKPEIFRDILTDDCSKLLTDFFKGKR